MIIAEQTAADVVIPDIQISTSEHHLHDDWWQHGLTLGEVLHRARLRLMVLRAAGNADPQAIRVVINDALLDLDAAIDALYSLDDHCHPKPDLLNWVVWDGYDDVLAGGGAR